MVNKWTPGKWRVEDWSGAEAQVVSKLNGNKSLICAGVMPADARLIAAAPDLYEALEALRQETWLIIGANHPAIAQAETTLARARGEAQ